MTMDEAISRAIASVLDPERVQEIVERRLTEMMKEWVRSALCDWGKDSPRALMKEKLNEALIPAIDGLSIDNAKLDLLLAGLVEESVVGERRALLGKFAELTAGDDSSVVKASEVFDRYMRWCARAYDCGGREIDMDDTPTYMPLECWMILDESPRRSWSQFEHAELSLYVEDCDTEQEDQINHSVSLFRSPDETLWRPITYGAPDAMSILEMSEFDVYLRRLEMCHTRIEWDVGGTSTYELVELEQDPECEWA